MGLWKKKFLSKCLSLEWQTINWGLSELVHWLLVMPHGFTVYGQHWFRSLMLFWKHQAIKPTNVYQPMFTYHHWSTGTLILGKFIWKCWSYKSPSFAKHCTFEITAITPVVNKSMVLGVVLPCYKNPYFRWPICTDMKSIKSNCYWSRHVEFSKYYCRRQVTVVAYTQISWENTISFMCYQLFASWK